MLKSLVTIPSQKSERIFPGISAELLWDVTTLSSDSKSFNPIPLAGGGSINGLTFSADATKFFIMGDTGSKVYQYTNVPGSLNLATYDSVSFDASAKVNDGGGLGFSQDGMHMYLTDLFTTQKIFHYTLGTAWDLGGTVTYADEFSLGDIISSVRMSTDGTKLNVVFYDNSARLYTLSTPFVVSSATLTSTLTTPVVMSELSFSFFSSLGSKMYLISSSPDNKVFQYTLSSPFDPDAETYDSKSYDFSAVGINPFGFHIYGGKAYFGFGGGDNKLYQFSIS